MESWHWLHCKELIVAKTWLVRVQAPGRNIHCSKATAVSSCTRGHHAEYLQRNQRLQGWHHSDCSAPVNKDDAKDHNGQVRLGGSVRKKFSVRTILNSTEYCKLLRQEISNRGFSCGEISKYVTWHTKLRPKRAKVCDLYPRHHSFIIQSPKNYFVCSDIANTPQLQSSWRCQCEVTVHRKMSALGTAGAMVTTHENSVMMWPFKGTKLFSVL